MLKYFGGKYKDAAEQQSYNYIRSHIEGCKDDKKGVSFDRFRNQNDYTTYYTICIEAEKIIAIGKSTAESYKLQVSAMGDDNFTKYKITEEIGKGNIKVIPDVLITGTNGSEGGISGL